MDACNKLNFLFEIDLFFHRSAPFIANTRMSFHSLNYAEMIIFFTGEKEKPSMNIAV